MGQGQDKIAASLTDLQPTAIVELFQLYFNTVDKPNDVFYFHGGAIFDKDIKWQGKGYSRLPVESEGFEVTANNQLPRPKIRISNKDYNITSMLLNNQDFQFAKVIRKRTFVKYLDDENFDGGNPWGQADASAELSNDTFIVSQKTAENKLFVELELSSPLDLENFEINNRLLIARYCSWYYRGNGCNYRGIPIETEESQTLTLSAQTLNNWPTVENSNIWSTGKSYSSGDAVFVFNDKIKINPHPSSSIKEIQSAKIWYVAQTGHSSTSYNGPDINKDYWLKDGCNKKIEGCKKRFGPNSAENNIPNTVINSYIDFSYKNSNYSNNIAALADITGSSLYAGSNFRNCIDGKSTAGIAVGDEKFYAWISSGTAKPWIQFQFNKPYVFNRIDLYDRASLNNFNQANIKIYSGESLKLNGTYTVNANGLRSTTGFANVTGDKILISGINSSTDAGLVEVAIFEPSGLGFYNDTFLSSGISTKDQFHIASWVNFPNGIPNSESIFNIFHNVKTNCQHSGLNLYVSGGNTLVLDFAVRQYSGAIPTYKTVNKSINIPFYPSQLQSIHVISEGGKTNGSSPTSFPQGYLEIRCGENSTKYITTLPNSNTKFSGEFFLFKNPSFTGSTNNLFLGVNNWQFSSGDIFSSPPSAQGIYSNTQLTSPARIASVAMWTGLNSLNNRINFFDREDQTIKHPRTYAELQDGISSLKTGLFAWWDMDLSDTSPYVIAGSNNVDNKFYLSGEYSSNIDFNTGVISYTSFINSTQQKQDYLPFGGFPGTDKYGR